ncbi:uncharacterized protein PV07_12108 [Cladophialophora immunda]|uniref:pH-response regulator protein palC n=1 Tax=Cladophialophora immunda TaxID=569365 RepID=A0A0D2ABP4_9EURO|nr:uncharacterized protein PV07_12108 [Cladophialophora immunda]KIW22197.1 hypothetical protein PV07_12108 [Cladophialophora immunda]OQU99877.1 hypothetical protein CLAIMM_05450 [Cladophialophora immunda]
MPFPFVLSTTSHISFQASLISSTHPSLPSATTSQRAALRAALKAHKRLSAADQATNLLSLASTAQSYIRYLVTLDVALSGKPVAGEVVDIALAKEPEIEWRPTLGANAIPGRENERAKGKGLDYELFFVHHTLALIQNLLARQSLLGLYSSVNPTLEQRTSLIQGASKCLQTAHAIHSYLLLRANSSSDGPPSFPPSAVDVSASVQLALQHLTHAEFNLLCVLKEDPYPAILVQSRNKDDKEWMIRAPQIAKVRGQVLTRLCIGAADHASAAIVALKVETTKASRELLEYCDGIHRASRAKACRFQALEEDTHEGQTGKAIAWLRAAMNELGVEMGKDGAKASGLGKLKASWIERREDKRIEKGSTTWGMDGGKLEEGRIVEYLDQKFNKQNDTINVQLIPEWKLLLALLPSGMNMPVAEKWKPAPLEETELAAMRAPPDHDELGATNSSDENEDSMAVPAGAFPGTQRDYGSGTSYY